jgi:hypothetical protein
LSHFFSYLGKFNINQPIQSAMKTKSLFFIICVISALFFTETFGQVGINTDGSSPDPSAGLDVNFSDKGFLPPCLTTSQINTISSPAPGLMVYNITVQKPQYFNGTDWRNFDGSYDIGQNYGGGIIFYVDGTGQHGLVAATSDQSTGAEWGCYGTLIGTSTAIGSGQANTTAIVNGCSTAGLAAQICNDLVLNGYNDWFLPSQDELNLMCQQKSVIGGFSWEYWSSSEYNSYFVYLQGFSNCYQGATDKVYLKLVRAVRAF